MGKWNLYIGLNIALLIYILAKSFRYYGDGNIELYLSAILLAFMIIGLYGHSRQRRIAARPIWRALFVILISVIGYMAFINTYALVTDPELMTGNNIKILTTEIIVMIFLVPALVGIYKYTYKSDHLWAEKNAGVSS